MFKKIIIASLSLVLILLTVSGFYVYRLLEEPLSTVAVNADVKTPEESQAELQTENQVEPQKIEEIENILILGLDRRVPGEAARSDTIMVATIDNLNDSIKLTSIMRDVLVSIPGRRDNKLNTAYALGGAKLAIETVNENFNLNISRFVVLDFIAFENAIDAIGGISIELSNAEVRAVNRNIDDRAKIDKTNLSRYHISGAGLHSLNGKQALAYARIRDIGNSDFDRVERQQIVLTKLFDKITNLNPLRFPALVSSVLPHMTTNISPVEILSFGTTVLGFEDKTIHRFRIPINNEFSQQNVRGASVIVLNTETTISKFHEFLNVNPRNVQ